MIHDEIPLWFAVAGAIASTIGYFVLKFRSDLRSQDGDIDRPGR